MQLEGKKVAYFPSYDHVDIIEGQGTCMVEVEEQAQEVWGVRARPDIVVCPIGGGGLMSGVSIASKGYWGKPGIKVVGAEPASESVSRIHHLVDQLIQVSIKVPMILMVDFTARRGWLLCLRAVCAMACSQLRVT